MKVLMTGPIAISGGVAMHTKQLIDHLRTFDVQILHYNTSSSYVNFYLNAAEKMFKKTFGMILFAILHRSQFDLIHVQASGGLSSFISALSGVVIARLLSQKLIITFHYSNTKMFINQHPYCFKFVLTHCSKMIVVSPSQVRDITKKFSRYSDKIICIPNGYDSEIYYPKNISIPEFKMKKNLKFVYTVSNLTSTKGQDVLIDAMYILSCDKNIVCYMAGKGDQYAILNKKIQDLGLQNTVKLLGWVSDDINAQYLNACDVFVFPSLHESFGIVLIEALACGKPCVATINGGSEGILTDNMGILVPTRDPVELAYAIQKALTHQWDNNFIAETAKICYNWDDIALKTGYLYNQVIQYK